MLSVLLKRIIASLLLILVVAPLSARVRHGSAFVGASKRSVINSNSLAIPNFAMLNMIQQNSFGPIGANWYTQTGMNWNSAILDGNGYCSTVLSTSCGGAGLNNSFGGGISYASSSNYSGQYILDGVGTCVFSNILNGSPTFTTISTTNASQASNGSWNLSGGSGSFKVTFTYTGPLLANNEFYISSNDPTNYCKSLRVYRNDGVDNVDINNGLFFRRPFLTSQLNLLPSYWRTLDWENTNQNQAMLWSNRALPGTGTGYVSLTGETWNASCAYTDTSNPSTNAWTITGVGGCTTTNMQNGELVVARFMQAQVRASNVSISSITNGAGCGGSQGEIATSSAHGFNANDIVIIPNMITGMTQLNLVPLKVATVVDSTHFCISTQTGTPINVSTYGAYSAGGCPLNGCAVTSYATLQVGTGSDRTAYPMFWADGTFPVSTYAPIAANSYSWFVFDKSIGIYDITGTFHAGVWRGVPAGGSNNASAYTPGMAAEIVAKFFIELNALSPAHPISPWVHIHAGGLLPMDADYTTGNDWTGNYINTLLNGNGSWAGIPSVDSLIDEYANETWNSNYSGPYLATRGFIRWGIFDENSFASLRSMLMVSDGKSFTSSNPRVKYVMGMFSTFGTTGPNVVRLYGNTYTLTDPLNVGGLATMAVHDYAAMAAYVYDSTGTAPLSTLSASWVSHIGNSVAQATDTANYMTYVTGTSSQQESINYYALNIMPQFATAMATTFPGKQIIGYEGGWNTQIPIDGTGYLTTSGTSVTFLTGSCPSGDFIISPNIPAMTTVTVSGSSGTLANSSTGTSEEYYGCYSQNNEFLLYVKQSAAWASAWMLYFNAFNSNPNAAAPADFIQLDQPNFVEWGHAWPASYGWGALTTEYQNLDAAWGAMVTRNATFPH